MTEINKPTTVNARNLEEAYALIGKAVVAFGSLESAIRWTLIGPLTEAFGCTGRAPGAGSPQCEGGGNVASRLPSDEIESIIAGPYDFTSLTKVCERILKTIPAERGPPHKTIENVFNRCRKIADDRNHLVHAEWHSGKGAMRISRNTLEQTYRFQTNESIGKFIKEANDLSFEVLNLYVIFLPQTDTTEAQVASNKGST